MAFFSNIYVFGSCFRTLAAILFKMFLCGCGMTDLLNKYRFRYGSQNLVDDEIASFPRNDDIRANFMKFMPDGPLGNDKTIE